jgi:hypothetical protein
MIRQWPIVVLGAAVLTAVLAWSPGISFPGSAKLWSALGHIAVFFCGAMIGVLVGRLIRKKPFAIGARVGGVLLGVGLLVWFHQHSWIPSIHTSEDGRSKSLDLAHPSDPDVVRWSDVFVTDESGHLAARFVGAYSETGKKHGPWVYIAFRPAHIQGQEWYWNGEKISEEEWHQRSGS